MFIQGEQGRKAIGLAITSTTASYLFSMIYIMPSFKPLTTWMSCFWNTSTTRVEASRGTKKDQVSGHISLGRSKKEQNWPNN